MVADGVHVLFAVALVMVVLRTERVEPYLVAILTASVPDLDRYLFTPFLYSGHLSGPMWTHRGITHSLLAFALVVAAAWAVGHWRPAVIGYGSHLATDFATGGIRLFVPLSIDPHGLYYDWMLGNIVVGAFSALVVLVGLGLLIAQDRRDAATTAAAPLDLDRWFR